MKKHFWIIAFAVAAMLAAVEGFVLLRMHQEKHHDERIRSKAAYVSHQPGSTRPRALPAAWQDPWTGLGEAWDPFLEMQTMQRMMGRLFQDTYHRGLVNAGRRSMMMSYAPEVDFQAKDDSYVATFDLPGLDKDKIDIKVRNRQLTVSGQREEGKTEAADDGSYQRMERSFGSFTRSIPLPEDASEEGITADSKNGVLTVSIPRRSDPAPSERTISVQ